MANTIKQISIMPSKRNVYKTEGNSSLRQCPHGAWNISEKSKKDKIMKNHGIEVVDITKEKANSNGGLLSVDGVTVVYDNHKLIGKNYDMDKFEKKLIKHFFDHGGRR